MTGSCWLPLLTSNRRLISYRGSCRPWVPMSQELPHISTYIVHTLAARVDMKVPIRGEYYEGFRPTARYPVALVNRRLNWSDLRS